MFIRRAVNSVSIVYLVILQLIVKFVLTEEIDEISGINICNSNFYAKQQCIDYAKEYRCKCNPGFVWNGEVCISTALNSYFEFEEKSTNAYVFYDKTFPKLTSFTISTWLQIYSRQSPPAFPHQQGPSILSSHSFLSSSSSSKHSYILLNDTRTVFTYSFENNVNAFRCQLSSTLAYTNKPDSSKINSHLYFTINILNSFCIFNTQHVYTTNAKNINSSLWFHLAITWNSKSGQMQVYINGHHKHTCNRIAQGKELNRAGEFILGQSHHPDIYIRRRSKQRVELDPKSRQLLFDLYSSDRLSSSNQEDTSADLLAAADPEENSIFEESTAFVGRLFNFNVWDRVPSRLAEFVESIVNDCRLVYCGNAAQWSEYRPGTRGNVKMKWPTYLLWSSGSCLNEKYQRETCNRVCSRDIGPECREHVEKNFRWPKAKLNETVKLRCVPDATTANTPLSDVANSLAAPKMAYRLCDIANGNGNGNGNNGNNGLGSYIKRSSSSNNNNNKNKNGAISEYGMSSDSLQPPPPPMTSWQPSNINECVQPKLNDLKNEIYAFTNNDNFDETLIVPYLDRLLDLTLKHLSSTSVAASLTSTVSMAPSTSFSRSIHDVSAIIDAMFNLINAQSQILKRNIDLKSNMGYPTYEETIKFTNNILAIVNVILGLSKDVNLWSMSAPIGSESMRIVKLIKQLSLTIYDFQRLNLLIIQESFSMSPDYSGYIDLNKIRPASSPSSSPNGFDSNYNLTNEPFALIEAKFDNIIFSQRMIFFDYQMPMNFKFPDIISGESSSRTSSTTTTVRARTTNRQRSNKTRKQPQQKANERAAPPIVSSYSSSSSAKASSIASISSLASDLMPSIFFGHILFNEHNVSLPLYKTTTAVNKSTTSSQPVQTHHHTQIDPLSLLTVYYSNLHTLLPNHNKTFREKDNNLNSVVMTVDLIGIDGSIKLNKSTFNATFNKPITLKYTYLEFFNISDTRCVNLEEINDNMKNFKWSRRECQVKKKTAISSTCECFTLGTFSITNDLYDPDWSPVIEENIPLIIPSYFGCIVVSLFGIATFSCLTYLKTKTTTTSVHKNLCISICLSQIILMISLTRVNYDKIICQSFALLNHFMLFVVFAWLLNEAFNLYITITYAAHQSTPMNDTGSQLRFYLLGWLLPAFTVLIYLLWYRGNYYDRKLCFFNLEHLSMNLIPMIALLIITIMVMIISAKEHTESSYTKNQKANKMIANHTKAVWTQIALLTLTWTFTFMSLLLFDPIVKYLFAFLNCLQGSFLFVFYFLLNEEVRKYLRERKRRKKARQRERNIALANNIKLPLSMASGQGGGGDGTHASSGGIDGLGGELGLAPGSMVNRKPSKYFREKFDLNGTGGNKYSDEDDDDDDDDDDDTDDDDDDDVGGMAGGDAESDEDTSDHGAGAGGAASGSTGGVASGAGGETDDERLASVTGAGNNNRTSGDFVVTPVGDLHDSFSKIRGDLRSVSKKSNTHRRLGASLSSTASYKSVKFGQISDMSTTAGNSGGGLKFASFNQMSGGGGGSSSPPIMDSPKLRHFQAASSLAPHYAHTSLSPSSSFKNKQQVSMGGVDEDEASKIATKVVLEKSGSAYTSDTSPFWSGQQMPPPATVALPVHRRSQVVQQARTIQITSRDIVPDYNEEKVTVL